MSNKRTVYLSDLALALPRDGESLSGRINQALERYSWMVAKLEGRIRAAFWPDQWALIADAARQWKALDPEALERAVIKALANIPAGTGVAPIEIAESDLIALAELAERDSLPQGV